MLFSELGDHPEGSILTGPWPGLGHARWVIRCERMRLPKGVRGRHRGSSAAEYIG